MKRIEEEPGFHRGIGQITSQQVGTRGAPAQHAEDHVAEITKKAATTHDRVATAVELPPSPAVIFKALNAHQETEALRAAIELDVFSALGGQTCTAAELAQRCATSERGMRILCDFLTASGFLAKEDHQYRLTPVSAEFLDRASPKCVASMAEFLGSPSAQDRFRTTAAAVRHGGAVAEDGLIPEHPMWVAFARGMAPLMRLPAELIAAELGADAAPPWKVLDIAAGHGVFGIALARHNPQAEIVAVDWPNVLEVAQENAQAAGVAARYRRLPGSAFEVDYGTGYDVALLTNFLHHFDPPTDTALLRKVHAALRPGGRAAALEFVPNADRVSPPTAAQFSLTMLTGTAAGDAYTFAELRSMFGDAGFSEVELCELPPSEQRLVLARK